MDIAYSGAADICYYTIKCIPETNARQKLVSYEITIEPEHTLSIGKDSFGALQAYGRVPVRHNRFRYMIDGVMEMTGALYEEAENADKTPIFSYPYGLNRSGEELEKYFNSLKDELEAAGREAKAPAYEKSMILMHRLHQDFAYEKGQTGVTTTAEEAWKLGKGVCQDYAHIYTALCHLAGIPCRYTAGFLVGEGASHAWVEILSKGKWIGLDPTNDVIVIDKHIKLGHGRDASDCHINRGTMRGYIGEQTQDIRVLVEEI